MGDFIEEALAGPTVFTDEEVFSFDYVPPELVERDDEQRWLAGLFKPALANDKAVTCRVTGRVGTGKTAIVKRFLQDLHEAGRKRGQRFEHVHVNCRRRSTAAKALHQVISHFDKGFPDRGFSVTEMLDSLKKRVAKDEAHVVIVLDEVDELLSKSGTDLIYNLSRFHEEPPEDGNVSLVLISQRDVFDMLDDASRSTMRRTNHLDLEPYTQKQLVHIVEQRADLGLRPGALSPDATDLITDIASRDGDARYAIELLHTAGKAADHAGDERIVAEHVRRAKAETRRSVWEGQVLGLPLHKQLTMLAIARALKKEGSYTTTGKVEEIYRVLCEALDEQPRGHTQFWTYLNELTGVGLIETKASGEGIVGSTTVISLPDVPAEEMEDVLEGELEV